MNLNGVLPVYKERGYTSNDVVSKLRGILKLKKIGHTGTLDPDAEGVLPVCLGKATKLISILSDTDKAYSCTCRLGITTDTEDMSGNVLSEVSCKDITEDAVRKAAEGFIGRYMQIPPMYSAKKVNGKKLYELARQGIVIERKPCEVEIKSLVIRDTDLINGRFSFDTECSKGTYIRSLCRDIGEALGCGASMESLLRTGACGFKLNECRRLSEIEELAKSGDIEDKIVSIEKMFSDLGEIRADKECDKNIRNGNIIRACVPDGRYRVYLSDGTFAAVYEVKKSRAVLKGYFLTD